jgi:hypothetical protein
MIKMVFLCRRRPDLSRDEYARRILESHAPLALVHHPNMRRYVIQIVEGRPADGDEIDSLPTLWFDSVEDFRERLYDSSQGRAIIQRDVQRFMGGSDAYATQERVHRNDDPAPARGHRSPGHKWMRLLARRSELSRSEFQRRWLEDHVPLVLKHQLQLSGYTSSLVTEKLSETGPEWDAFEEQRFPDTAPEPRFDSPEGERAVASSRAALTVQAPAYRIQEYIWK